MLTQSLWAGRLVAGLGSEIVSKLTLIEMHVSTNPPPSYLINDVNAEMTPPPTSYKIKTSFDGHSPTIRNNTLTTSFKQQSDRNAFTKAFTPGDR